MMATYYLNPQLVTGANDGSSEADAFQSWATAVTHINTNHADMEADTEGVDLYVGGTLYQQASADITWTFASSATYPLRIISLDPSPGVWDETKPGWQAGTTFSTGPNMVFDGASVKRVVEFIDFQLGTGSSQRPIRMINAAAAGSRITMTRGYVKGATSGGSARNFFYEDGTDMPTLSFRNTVFSHFVWNTAINRLFETNAGQDGPHELLNCTYLTNATGDKFSFTSGTTGGNVRMQNCLLAADFELPGTHGSVLGDYNATALATTVTELPGASSTYEAALNFVSSTDAHLTAANGYGIGPDDVTIGAYVPTTDIDGDTRTGSVTDAGVDLFVGGAAQTPPYVNVTIGG